MENQRGASKMEAKEAHKPTQERPGDRDMVYCPGTCRSEIIGLGTTEDVCSGCDRTVDLEAVFGKSK